MFCLISCLVMSQKKPHHPHALEKANEKDHILIKKALLITSDLTFAQKYKPVSKTLKMWNHSKALQPKLKLRMSLDSDTNLFYACFNWNKRRQRCRQERWVFPLLRKEETDCQTHNRTIQLIAEKSALHCRCTN